jgi:hypothetical protein
MKGKLAVAIGVVVATVVLVVLMCLGPKQAPIATVFLPAPRIAPASTGIPKKVELPDAESVPPAPQAAPAGDDLGAIDDRLREAVPRLPLAQRVARWWVNPGPHMPAAEYEAARAMYMRYLDNFARIKTAQFRVEQYELLKGGSQRLKWVADVVWAPSGLYDKERVDTTEFDGDGNATNGLTVSDGRNWAAWEDGKIRHRGRNFEGYGTSYLRRYEMSAIRERAPYYLNYYEHCEVDNGSAGYSRIWGEKWGGELRFDTSTGMLTERRAGWQETKTYQQVDGIWFPLETVNQGRSEDGSITGERSVFSRVVLNEPVDESVFDMNKSY